MAGERALSSNRDLLDGLNVFPVPDGDTGTNMLQTVRYILNSDATSADGLYRACLLGAQGNSGLLLSYLFKGFAQVLGDGGDLDIRTLAGAFAYARSEAVAGIPDPREGTIITVYGEVAQRLQTEAEAGQGLERALGLALEQAVATVRETPQRLPILKEAGVVDSGGLGVAVLLRGALDKLQGKGDGSFEQSTAELGVAGEQMVKREFIHGLDEEWGYCTGFAVRGEALAIEQMKAKIEPQGSSFLLLGDATLAKIHIHTDDPGAVLSSAVQFGELSDIEITNMSLQTATWAEQHQRADADDGTDYTTGVIIVANGAGMLQIFGKMVPAGARIVDAGELMNPNVEQILNAVQSLNADEVLILPNNKDAVVVSESAADLADKTVRVLHTSSMAAGLVALVEFDATRDLETNYETCKMALEQAVCGGVSRATRAAKIGDLAFEAGDYLAFVGDQPILTADTAENALKAALSAKATDGAIIGIYYGANVATSQAKTAEEELKLTLSQAEGIEFFAGGQAFYDYIFSVEI